MKGSGLKVNEIKEFLQGSYKEQPEKYILGYVLDEELSNLQGRAFAFFPNANRTAKPNRACRIRRTEPELEFALLELKRTELRTKTEVLFRFCYCRY